MTSHLLSQKANLSVSDVCTGAVGRSTTEIQDLVFWIFFDGSYSNIARVVMYCRTTQKDTGSSWDAPIINSNLLGLL